MRARFWNNRELFLAKAKCCVIGLRCSLVAYSQQPFFNAWCSQDNLPFQLS